MSKDQLFMLRCLELAALGAGDAAPNPMVGAVLVYQDRIIGEGFHEKFGQAHAEVNCINSVKASEKDLISRATLYVSLEPCSHFGKTPPCSLLIIDQKIPEVVIGMQDPFAAVNGKGILQLKNAGVRVKTGVLEEECKQLNKSFICFHQNKRPYIVLKWAQSVNGKIAGPDQERVLISNEYTGRLVHKWRTEEAAILVGTNTALLDDPLLDNRFWFGNPPLKMVVDRTLRLPGSLKLFHSGAPPVIFNELKESKQDHRFSRLDFNHLPEEICKFCYNHQIQSVLIEGGSVLLQSFIDSGLWDEARVITNPKLQIENGKDAPALKSASLRSSERLLDDQINYFVNREH